MSRRPDRDPYDSWGQDRYVSGDEERFAAEMGQPSDLIDMRSLPGASVLCQSSVRCSRCDRMTIPMEDVLSLDAEGNWAHAECV